MPKKTYDQLVTENKKIKELMTHTAEEYNKGCTDRYKLKQENSMLRDLLQDRMPVGCIAETTYQPTLDENEKLKEEIEKLKKQKRNLVEGSRKVRKLESESHQNQKKGDYIMKLEEENKELKAKIDDLEGRLEDVDHIAGEWEDQVEELKEDYKSMTKHRDTLLEESEESFMKIHNLEEEMKSLKKSNEQKTKIIRKTRKQAQDLLKGENE